VGNDVRVSLRLLVRFWLNNKQIRLRAANEKRKAALPNVRLMTSFFQLDIGLNRELMV
jgi:hypothetical protein